ncbi:hypothetical protein ACLK19_01625 [Escherichia coli]
MSTVVAYDLSADMLDVVAQAAEVRQLKNITTRRGYAEVCHLPITHLILLSAVILPITAPCGAALREVNWISKPGGR